MSYEADFCSPTHYERGFDERLRREDLVKGTMYIVMFELVVVENSDRFKRAGKRPGFVRGLVELLHEETDFYSVPMTVVRRSPELNLDTVGAFSKGVYEAPVNGTEPALSLHGIKASHAYFRRISPDRDADLDREISKLRQGLAEHTGSTAPASEPARALIKAPL